MVRERGEGGEGREGDKRNGQKDGEESGTGVINEMKKLREIKAK